MQDVYKYIEKHYWSIKCNVLIVFDDMANEIISNRKVSPTVTELFNTGKKLNISTILFSNTKRW